MTIHIHNTTYLMISKSISEQYFFEIHSFCILSILNRILSYLITFLSPFSHLAPPCCHYLLSRVLTHHHRRVSYHILSLFCLRSAISSILAFTIYPSPMFWLTITEEFRQNFGHVADVLDAGVDVVELGRKFQIWNEIKKLRNGTQHSGRTLTSSSHGQGFKPSHSCCFWEEENGKKHLKLPQTVGGNQPI